ncbi:MAG: MFS transporter [Armatimonadota bacterium]|nr:MFS transporter [Armatimonadota bacterium]
MSVQRTARETDEGRGRLFLASCIALVATGMTFSIRGDIMDAWGKQFTLNDYQVGLISGAAFYGFMLSILFGGALVDALGMRAILALAFAAHVSGLVVTISASGFGMLYAGTLLVGIGNGLVEAACNPLVTTLYPDRKTQRLNAFHAWFPGGLILGGLTSYAMTQGHLGWHVKLAAILVVVAIYGLLFLTLKLPQTERVQASVSTADMYREIGRPVFLLLFFCMFLTAATELVPNQWIPASLGKIAGASGILVLVFINALMFVGRSLAGPIVHRVSPVGLIACSSVLSAIGLFSLGRATTPGGAYLAATVFALGICYYWPTMLGLTSERFPRGGSLLLGIMGAAGNLSVALFLPYMGHINDTQGPAIAFQKAALLPIILVLIFASLYLSDRAKGGYKPELLEAPLRDL